MPTRPKFPLRTTLIVPFVLQTISAVGLIGFISYRSGQQAVNNVASQLRTELTNRITEKLASYTSIPYAINRLNASAFSRGNIDVSNVKGESQFWHQMNIYPTISFVYCSDENGSFLGVGRLSERDRSKVVFEFSNATTNFIPKNFDFDSQGNRLKRLPSVSNKPFDPRSRPWYRAAKEARQEVWSEIYLDFSTLFPTVTASTPVYSRTDNSFIGVCAVDFFLPQEVSIFLSKMKIGQTGTAFIIERSGRLVATSSKESIVVGTGENSERILASESSNPTIRATAQYLNDRFNSLAQIESVKQLDFLKGTSRQYVQIVPFSDRNLDWLVIVTVPESDFMAQIDASRRNALWLSLAALGIAIVVGIVTTHLIVRPVLKLTQASKELAEGNLGQRINSFDAIDIAEIETLEQSFNRMARQLQESFETLEDKVKDRTADLAKANAEILALNEKLKAENLRMGAEIDVARQIQKMILPKPEELANIEGLEIAGYMEPADEVGGDYYDVLQTDGVITLGIGDVTGHGLESGLLMLMTQTAVRTLKEVREHDPVKFLDTLNRTLYQNVQRINSDKSLTLALLNYSEGRLTISGQHEETIVVRQGGHIERIDTMDLGFPIALDDDISPFINHILVELQPGDGVVLYTDGITEAKNLHKQQYGIEQLCQVISRHWHQSVEEIKEAVIADVRRHIGNQKVFDDITLLVLKRQAAVMKDDA